MLRGKWLAKTRKGRTFQGAAFCENGLRIRSAWSSDRARTVIVAGGATAGGSEMGPGERHGRAV
jgi:hypothetical protein